MDISRKRPCAPANRIGRRFLRAASVWIQRKAGRGVTQALPAALRAHDQT